MAVTVSQLLVQISASTSGLDRQLTGASKKVFQFGQRLERAGTAATQGIALPLAAAGGVALKMAGDFDQALTKSTAIMGDLSGALRDDLETTARDVAKNTVFSARQTAEAYYFLASAGFDAAQSIAALPAVTAFATAGNFDLARATDLATDAQAALGLVSDDAQVNLANLVRTTDVLVKANTLANASAEQFSEALTNQAGASLRQVNKDLEEGVAVLAVYANQGQKGAEAGTKLFQVLRDLQKSAIANRSGFEDLGIEVFDSAGQMRNMADIIEDFEEALAGASNEQSRMILSQLELQEKSIGALLSLIGFSDAIRDYEIQLRNAGGTTDTVAARQIQNLNDQMSILLGKVADVAIELGQALTPSVLKLMASIEGGIAVVSALVSEFRELPEFVRDGATFFAAFLTVLGPGLLTLGLVSKAIALIVTELKIMGALLFALATNPIALLAVALGGATLAMGIWAASTRGGGAETQAFGREVETATQKLQRLKSELNENSAEIKAAREEVEKLEKKISELSDPDDPVLGNIEANALGLPRALDEARKSLEKLTEGHKELEKEAAESEIPAAYERFATALNNAQGAYRGTQNDIELTNAQLRATEELLRELGKLGEDEAILGGLRERADGLRDRLEALNEAAAEGKQDFVSFEEILARWNDQMREAEVLGGLVGDQQLTLNQQMTATRAAIEETTAAMLEQGRSQEEIAFATSGMIARLRELENQLIIQQSSWTAWGEQMNRILTNGTQAAVTFGEVAFSAFRNFADGVGQAFGRALFFGEDFGKSMINVAKQVGAQFVGTLASMAIQLGLFALATKVYGLGIFTSMLGVAQGRTFAGAYASVIEALPFPANIVAAPLVAATQVAALTALSLPYAALAEGGLTTGEGFALLHPNEVVAPIDKVSDLFGKGGGAQTIVLQIDRTTIAEMVVEGMPDVVHLGLGTGGTMG